MNISAPSPPKNVNKHKRPPNNNKKINIPYKIPTEQHINDLNTGQSMR